MKTLKIEKMGIEVEKRIHDKGKRLSDIKIPKGWRLLRVEEMIYLFNNHEEELNLSDTREFIKQPFKKFGDKFVAWFDAYSDWASLGCCRRPDNSSPALGVRFCRDIQKKKVKQ